MSDHLDRAAEVIAAHVGKPANGGTANGAWVDCACLAEVKGVSRDHATSLHRKHVARALDAAGLLVTPERDAAVAAKALREAADDVYASSGEGQWPKPSVIAYLRDRAARFEREAGESDADA